MHKAIDIFESCRQSMLSEESCDLQARCFSAADEIERLRRACASMREDCARAGNAVVAGDIEMEKMEALALAAAAEIESLRAFSRAVLECWPDADVGGDMLQDLAVQHGLLEPQTKTMPCSKESCRCREYYASDQWVDGIICYRRTALVLGA